MRRIGCAFIVALLVETLSAQQVRLNDVVARLDAYIQRYGEQLANVVAEETYRQSVEDGPDFLRHTSSRILRSDYALTFVADRWVGYRDTFDVDGRPVRDREARLQNLLSRGAVGQASQIAEQNARFNLGEDLVSRTVNIPTFALEMMQPHIRARFRLRRAGVDALDGRPGWLLEFRERERPTLVRTPEGRDQASHIIALVDTQSGEVLRTVVTWEHIKGSITVTYGSAPDIAVPVPIRMSEHFVTHTAALVDGEATYTNFRRFQTSGRVIP